MNQNIYSKVQGILALLLILCTQAWGQGNARAPEKAFFFFGSAGDVTRGFDFANNYARFNVDCRSSKYDPNLEQITLVAPYTNKVMELDWGGWGSAEASQGAKDCMVKRLVAAKAFGDAYGRKMGAIVSVAFILFDATNTHDYVYRGHAVVVPELEKFFLQLEKNGVIDMVRDGGACYIQDEPGLYGITDEEMRLSVEAIQTAAARTSLGRCRTYVIYHYGGYPGIQYVDVAGQDHYDIGSRIVSAYELQLFKSMLRPLTELHPQWMSIVPGGSFGQDPQPFYEALMADPQIGWMNPFIYFNAWKSLKEAPIHGSVLARQYCEVGKRIVEPDVQNPDCTTPPPIVTLQVNGEEDVVAKAGEELCYTWATAYTDARQAAGSRFTSHWRANYPSCASGLNAGKWVAATPNGSFCWPADAAQAGCTYTITFAGCGPGATCAADSITVTIVQPNPIARPGRR